MFDVLKATADGPVAVLEFDHGKANEVGSDLLADLERLPAWFDANGVVAAISHSRRTSSRGTPIFVAGANVAERQGWSDERVKAHVRWQRSVLHALRAAPVFHIAVVGGVALGWGTEYLLVCDYRIATPGAVFGLPETGLGILPGAGGSSELWRQIGVAQALRLGMTGERIDLDEAVRIGLVQESARDAAAGMARAKAMAQAVAQKSPTALAAFKSAVLASIGEQGIEAEAVAYEHCVDTGQAALGRENFTAILAGEPVAWGTRQILGGTDARSK